MATGSAPSQRERPRLALTGLSGFVGTAVAQRLAARYAILDLYHRRPAAGDGIADHQPQEAGEGAPAATRAKEWGALALIHLAAAADVDACERECGEREAAAYRANVHLPGSLARDCAAVGLRFLHVSTDYVFDGQAGPYREADRPTSAANWYGQTKLEGERAVTAANPAAAIVRPSLPYGPEHPRKGDLPRLVRRRLAAGQPFAAAVDQLITPTWLGDLADGLALLAGGGGGGVYHLAGGSLLSPYDAALIVARTFGLDESLVRPSTLKAIGQAGRAPRPRSTALLCDRFDAEFGAHLRRKGFAEGVGLLRDASA